jgi:hypothetical protein
MNIGCTALEDLAVSQHYLNTTFIADTQYAAGPASAIIFWFRRFFLAGGSLVSVMFVIRAFTVLEDSYASVCFFFAQVV